jgi:hypothetical protein
MERYHIFQQLHKGLQTLLYDTAILLQQTDFNGTEEAKTALEKLNTFLHLYTQYTHIKEHYLLPAVQRATPATAFALAQQQGPEYVSVQRLQGLITMYDHTVSTEDKREAGISINNAYTGFMIAILRNMNREEEAISSVLRHHYTEAEILSIEQQMMAGIPASEMKAYSQWMIRGMNNLEITGWLKTAERMTDTPVFQSVLAFAEQELSSPRWQKVRDGLTEGMLIA